MVSNTAISDFDKYQSLTPCSIPQANIDTIMRALNLRVVLKDK